MMTKRTLTISEMLKALPAYGVHVEVDSQSDTHAAFSIRDLKGQVHVEQVWCETTVQWFFVVRGMLERDGFKERFHMSVLDPDCVTRFICIMARSY